MTIPIISGTNRPGNLTLHVARHCEGLLAGLGMDPRILSLEDLPPDIAFSDLYGRQSAAFVPFQELVHRCHDFIFVVPEYNGSIPGILKLFIDACEYPDSFRGKRATLIGISAGAGGNKTGLRHLHDILDYLGTEVLPIQVRAGRIRQKMERSGTLTHERLLRELQLQMEELVRVVRG